MAYELFVDSFDTESFSTSGTLQTSRWQIAATGPATISTSSGNGRHGSSSLRVAATSNGLAALTSGIFAASSHVVFGFSRQIDSGSGTSTFIFRNSTTTLITVTIASTGVVSVTLGSTTYNSTNAVSTDAYIEIGIIIGNSGSLEVRVNGSNAGWLNLSGVDTQPGADTTINNVQFRWQGASVGTADHDDLYITYGDELKWLGDIRVDALALTADSTPQDWTPDTGNAWERLNNASAGYITGTTLDDESLFALADYTPQTTAIHGVQVSAHARKTDAGSRSMAIEVKSDTTTDVGDTIALGDTTTEYRQVWLTDPDTAAAWTDGGLDALEIGVKVMD
jgi:hypothetical protein